VSTSSSLSSSISSFGHFYKKLDVRRVIQREVRGDPLRIIILLLSRNVCSEKHTVYDLAANISRQRQNNSIDDNRELTLEIIVALRNRRAQKHTAESLSCGISYSNN
jgi:hypothetical protein